MVLNLVVSPKNFSQLLAAFALKEPLCKLMSRSLMGATLAKNMGGNRPLTNA